jgi:small-conductance mechanosensitive channel
MMIEKGHGYTIQGTIDAIAHIATAMASDSETVATLTATNVKLASQLEAAEAYSKTIKDEISALRANIKPACQGQRPAKSTNNNDYCWSHGHQVHKDHTSATCKARKYRHQETSNKDNTMGGFAWGKE